MSRSLAPSLRQQEKLLDLLVKHNLATGHARTEKAKQRSRAAWQQIASYLNNEGTGCIKTWQRWAKYWKDKKSALKRKVSKLHAAQQQTGAVQEDLELTEFEEQMISVLGGVRFALGDIDLETNPLQLIDCHLPTSDNDSKSFMQGLTSPAEAESMASQAGTLTTQQSPITSDERTTGTLGQSEEQKPMIIRPDVERESAEQRRPGTSASLRWRRATHARRRMRTPSSPIHLSLGSLTERFIAIEERRVEVEMANARSLETLAHSFDRATQGYHQHGLAMQSLADSIRIVIQRSENKT